MDKDSEMFMKNLDVFWGGLFEYNLFLLKKSEKEEEFGKESFEEVMDVYLTAQAQELIKGYLFQQLGSLGSLLAARCFLEGLAIKKRYRNGKISPLQIELLRKQVFIIEYNHYKNFSDIAEVVQFSETLEKDYHLAVDFFYEKLSGKFSEKEIKCIIKGETPFLCDPKLSYRKLIEIELGEEYAKLYGLYSQAVHPSPNNFYNEEDVWKTLLLILKLIFEEYKELKFDWQKTTFNSHRKRAYSSIIAQEYEEIVKKECEVLSGISNVFEGFFQKNNYVSNLLNTLIFLVLDSCSDFLLGLREEVKSKWKIVLEMFASVDFCYIKGFPKDTRYALLQEHKRVQFKRNMGEKPSLDKAYEIYIKEYPSGVPLAQFSEAFLSTTGFTIDENGCVQTLTGLVKEFLKKVPSSDDPAQAVDRHWLLNYVESQMVSHANGYLWYANAGAFQDVYNVIIGTDSILLYILEVILKIFQMHRSTEKTKFYKKIINVIRNGIGKIVKDVPRKCEILKMKCVNL